MPSVSTFDRVAVILAEWNQAHPEYLASRWPGLAAPYGFVEEPPLRWRLSCDVYEQLQREAGPQLTAHPPLGFGDRLYGIRVDHDCFGGLPPNSVILEPRP